MKNRLAVLLIALFLGLGISYAATEQEVDQRLDFLFGSHQEYHAFFNELQSAVAKKDRAKVAAMVDYPFEIVLKGKQLTLRNPNAFKQRYSAIFTPELTKIIVDQKYEDLFARDQGVMVGDSGQLWFSGICRDSACKKVDIRILRINP